MPLTDIKIKKAGAKEKAYKLSDGKGLYLEVRLNGSKYWRYKYRFVGKEKLLALGVYPETECSLKYFVKTMQCGIFSSNAFLV